jgi:uncharacterized heparinase superfamily protein
MALNLLARQNQAWLAIAGADAKQVFDARVRDGQLVRVPSQFHALPDFRPASEAAALLALQGTPPHGSGLARFDPLKGPFSIVGAQTSAWVQGLDFLRDIKNIASGSTQLTHAWVKHWLDDLGHHPDKSPSLFTKGQGSSGKTERLIWRSRRVLNCLCHVLPIASKLDPSIQTAFWHALMNDIAKIAAPTQTLWASLSEGFDPLSPRAIWLRAVAVLGVEASFPGYLRQELVDNAVDSLKASIQKDGLIAGGSIIGTLSAGADLCMLARIPAIEPLLATLRPALASLRHSDGSLVTFGVGAADYVHLLHAVLGPGDWKPASLFLESGIARMSAQGTTVWMRAPQSHRASGAACEIEVDNFGLLTSFESAPSALVFTSKAQVTQGKCRRRDEPDQLVMEANAVLALSGKTFVCVRQIRITKNGRQIEGEDFLRPETARQENGRDDVNGQEVGVLKICFGIADSAACFLSRDRQSVLIVTSQQQAWRFRVQGMDIGIEMGSDQVEENVQASKKRMIVCRYPNPMHKNDFKASWQFVSEDVA